ncbi:MAG: DNA-directed DNA polymerase alpha subunit pol12 [Candelina submexicana]|nr:MAG: DNA-directed DNA polymerase alpha subunit pol12 [Candelina submexicana]
MDNTTEELNERFASTPGTELPVDVLGELQSILRLHSITPEELFFKWESYCLTMGSENTKLDFDTARALKKDVQEGLERGSRGKVHGRNADRKVATGPSKRNNQTNDDVLGMLDGLVPATPQPAPSNGVKGSTFKRKAAYETPAASKSSKGAMSRSPKRLDTPLGPGNTNGHGSQSIPFADRLNAGQIIETLNPDLSVPEPPTAPFAKPRVKVTARTDLDKFSYRPMAMHLSEASEVLDDRIDEFMALLQAHHGLDDAAFGNPASQSTSEVIAVGRIASDSMKGRLNAASLVLETSRRMGAGLRVPLKVGGLPGFGFFPGQIVALRGVNASGEYFSVKEILSLPLLPVAVSRPVEIDLHNERLREGLNEDETQARALSTIFCSGPYTTDDDLAFEALHALCARAVSTCADALILNGPFLDVEHPLLASGDFDLPMGDHTDPETATLQSVFNTLVAAPLRDLAQSVPSITIILIPSIRDAISRHVSWPQDRLSRRDLGLPKQARLVSNPFTFALNEVTIGASAQDVLSALRLEEVISGKLTEPNILARLASYLIDQRHFFPLFPPPDQENLQKASSGNGLPVGAGLDTSYLRLGEWLNVRPDVLITPSVITPFAKVVDGVVVINPGSLSKQKGAGTYAQLTVHPADLTTEQKGTEEYIAHEIFKRGRVDIIKI